MFSNIQQPFPNAQRALRNVDKNAVRDENRILNLNGSSQSQKPNATGKPNVTTRAATRRNALEDVSNIQGAQLNTKLGPKGKSIPSIPAQKPKIASAKVSAVKTSSAIKGDEKEKRQINIKKVPASELDATRKHESSDAREHERQVEERRKKLSRMRENIDWDDLDSADKDDPLMVSEYVVEIMEYMKELERKIMPNPNYLQTQPEIRSGMRSILIDWLVEVHWKFKLLPETLFLTVNIIDRFLSLRIVHLTRLQLVGVVAMLIASKYEELLAPSISNFVFLSDNGFKESQIMEAERYVLGALGFNLAYPNPMVFLRRVSKAEDYDIQTRTLAKYLMEVTLIDSNFISVHPSIVAATAILLARKMLNRGPWNANLIHYSGYFEDELTEYANMMFRSVGLTSKYQAIYKKYESKKFMRASVFVSDYITKFCNDGTEKYI